MTMLQDIISEFSRYRTLGQKTLEQLPDTALNQALGEGNNSIAVIVRHISGNLISRFTDFLTTDGEKPWRDRDAEFADHTYTRTEVMDWWDKGWRVLTAELAKLTEHDLQKQVTIRGQTLTVHEALTRSLAHTAYHVGQIVLLARIAQGENWQTLSIARGRSAEYNKNPANEKKSR
jgi:uncharacterized damage-inducible protein DinB